MNITAAQKTELKTVTHEDYFTFVPYGLRLGFVHNDKYVFKNDGDFKRKAENVVAFYFGFSSWVEARRFESWIRQKCLKLNSYHSHCTVRESKRLTTAFEVKCRNIDYDILFPIFKELVMREIEKGHIDFDYDAAPKVLTKEEVQVRLKRLT
jgi:hypothetical protein